MEDLRFFWNMAYRVWPAGTKTAKTLGFHNVRHHFLLGRLNANYNKHHLEKMLHEQGFEKAIIAWREPGEVLSVRKIDRRIFQYHLRLFIDGEIRAHYEYMPEAKPLGHFLRKHFEPRAEYFKKLLGDHLVVE